MIVAGIVTYNPNIIRLNDNFVAIQNQVNKVVLIDNGSENIKDIIDICSRYEILALYNEKNMGIAYAFNQIFDLGNQIGATWILTLDQDSICSNDLIHVYKQYMNNEMVGICFPCIEDRNDNDSMKNKEKQEKQEKQIWCISSGSLISVEAWNCVHGFDNELFIDLVDYDFCHRLTRNGYRLMYCKETKILHELGNCFIKRKFLWRTVFISEHEPLRYYYYVKNCLYLCRKLSIPILIVDAVKCYIKVLLYESNKKTKLQMMNRGFFEGFHMKKHYQEV